MALVAQYHEYHDSIYLALLSVFSHDDDTCSKAELLGFPVESSAEKLIYRVSQRNRVQVAQK